MLKLIQLKIIVNNYLKRGKYSRVRLYDDHMKNLKSFLELKDDYPNIEFMAYKVTDGKVKEVA